MAIMIAAAAGASPVAAQAGAPAAGENPAEIVVIGMKNPYRLTVKQLRAAVAAYQRGRPRSAPQSTLFFEVSARGGGSLEGLSLSLRGEGQVIPIELDAADRFVLPSLASDRWELVANRRRAGIAIRPLVLSPGTSEEDRRLGDMRLQCEVTWAIEKANVSIFSRGLFEAAGACKASKIAIYAHSERGIAEATVRNGSIVKPIQVLPDRHNFRAPLHDKSMPDSARVRFRFL